MLLPKISSRWSDSQSSLHNPLSHNGCQIGFCSLVHLSFPKTADRGSVLQGPSETPVVTCEEKWGSVTGWDSRESHLPPSRMFLWLHGYFVSEFLWFWASNLGPRLWQINTLPLDPTPTPQLGPWNIGFGFAELSLSFLRSMYLTKKKKMCVRCIV